MIPKRETSRELQSLISFQHGLFTREQCLTLGGSVEFLRRMVRQRRFHRLAAGLYSAVAEPDWLGWAWGGLLLGGSHATLGGSAAAHLHGFAGQPSVIEVWAPVPPRVTGPWKFRRGSRLGRGEPSRVSAVEALLEVASAQEGEAAQATIIAALHSRRVSATTLNSWVMNSPRLRNRRFILEALELAAAGAESVLEARFLERVERAHGLPAGARQVSISSGTRTDVGYLQFGVLVELDGRLGHEGSGAFRDAARDNAHALQGWVTLRFGWLDVTRRPCQVATILATTLNTHGWRGELRECPRCR